ncbi:MAG TPA: helix-turn-helix domain-containing protein [Mycobacteriales bacterium]|nr:helix-turn-helix domain-containing protein [Mycobacteriales bacterium]
MRLSRAIVVLMSAQGQAVRDITSLLGVGEDYVREVIHAFNKRGFPALDPKWSGGRPRRIGEQVRERICLIARMSPADWGITEFARPRKQLVEAGPHAGADTIGWNLAHHHSAEVSRATINRILTRAGTLTPDASKRPNSSYIRFQAA